MTHPRRTHRLAPIWVMIGLLWVLHWNRSDAAPSADEDGSPDPTAGSPPLHAPLPEGEHLPFDDGTIPVEIERKVHETRHLPIGERVAAISDILQGTPYLNDAAGEGVLPDLDPPVRYDAFDCLTFVEEVLALAISADPRSAARVRNSLRYGEGQPRTYEDRQHFMLQQWVPQAIAAGWLRDITAELGETRIIEKTVTAQTWRGWKGRRLFLLPDARLPTGTFQLPVLPPGVAWESAPAIPTGAVVLTVRENKAGVPIVVTHLGFKVDGATEDEPLFRHATKMGSRPRVRSDKLRWYVEHNRWYHWWPVAGFTVLMPQEMGPRKSALPAK